MSRSEIVFLLGSGAIMLAALVGASMATKTASAKLGYSIPFTITWEMMAQPCIAGLTVGLILAFRLYRKAHRAGEINWYKPYIIGLFMTTVWIVAISLVALTA